MQNKDGMDQKIRDLMIASASNVEEVSEPTIISLNDTVISVERKYGKCWMDYPDAKCIVIWASKMFMEDHIKEIIPDLYELCMEYRTKETINGKNLPSNFFLLPFSLFERNEVYDGPYGTSPVSGAYWKYQSEE